MSTTNFTWGGIQAKTILEMPIHAPLFGRWASTRTNSFLSSPHSPLRHSVSWQFSYPCCPSQVIFPSTPLYRCLATTDLLIAFLIKKKHIFITSLTRQRKKENYIVGSHRLTFPCYCLVLSSILEESFDLITGFNEIIPFSANLYLNWTSLIEIKKLVATHPNAIRRN